MTLLSIARTALALTAVVGLASATPGGVWVVDEGGTADFTDIQPAVNAANAGDTILVLPGTYLGFSINAKSLSIAGDQAQFIRVDGKVTVRHLAASDSVTMSGLNLRNGLLVTNCTGHVGIADSHLETLGLNLESGVVALQGQHQIVESDDVVFTRSILRGRDGSSQPFGCGDKDGIDGESAIMLRNAAVAFYSCEMYGGAGGASSDGSCGPFCNPAYQGDGGNGLSLRNGGYAYVDDSIRVAGVRGSHQGCSPQSNSDGFPVSADFSSFFEVAADPTLSFDSPTVVREDEVLPVTVTGPAGAQTWMLWSDVPTWRPLGGAIGLLHIESQSLALQSLGTIPGSGVLSTTLTPPPVAPGMGARRLFIQVFAIDGAAGRLLGTTSGLVVLDPVF